MGLNRAPTWIVDELLKLDSKLRLWWDSWKEEWVIDRLQEENYYLTVMHWRPSPEFPLDLSLIEALKSRDMQRETPFEHIKRNTGQELYDRTLHDHERLPNRTWAEYNVQYTDLSDFCTLAPEGWRCSRRLAHEGPCAARPVYDAYGESKATALYARRVDKDF